MSAITEEALKLANKLISLPMGDQTYAKEIRLLLNLVDKQSGQTTITNVPMNIENMVPMNLQYIQFTKENKL